MEILGSFVSDNDSRSNDSLLLYYFCFFLAAGFCIWLLINREWKNIFIYIGTVAASAGTVLMIFPAILTHLFHGEVGNTGCSRKV